MNRENRYVVFKNRDLEAYLSDEDREILDDLYRKVNRSRLLNGKEILQCAVVEHDWPEYEPVWQMVAERVDAKPKPPIYCSAAGAGLVVHIAPDTLRFAAESHPGFWDGESGASVPKLIITDINVFAKEVAGSINDEAEDGSTLLTILIDEAISNAVENGCEGAEIPHGR